MDVAPMNARYASNLYAWMNSMPPVYGAGVPAGGTDITSQLLASDVVMLSDQALQAYIKLSLGSGETAPAAPAAEPADEGTAEDPAARHIAEGDRLLAEYVETGDEDTLAEAIAYYRIATEDAPGDERTWRALAEGYLAGGKYADAKAAFETALELNPRNAESLAGLAHAMDELGDGEAAAALFEQALDAAPDSSSVLYRYGQHLHRLGDDPGAIEALNRALQLDPGNTDILALLRLIADAPDEA